MWSLSVLACLIFWKLVHAYNLMHSTYIQVVFHRIVQLGMFLQKFFNIPSKIDFICLKVNSAKFIMLSCGGALLINNS